MEKTTIYIATHKLFIPPFKKIYKPIVAGADLHMLPYQPDNTGENISSKNPYYSELTALYWIWKNDQSKYVGLMHYHRYFFNGHLLSEQEIKEILRIYDIIVPTSLELETSVYNQYALSHHDADLQLACSEMIKRDYNYRAYIDTILNQNKLYICNMFISSKDIIDNYLSFLFPILFSLEKQISYQEYFCISTKSIWFLSRADIYNLFG